MGANDLYNERELLRRVSKGDQAAYETIFTAYWGKIYANALAFTKSPEPAKDLAQDVFIKIWLKRDKLSGVEKFAPYLYRLARNVFYDHLDKKVLDQSYAPFLTLYFQDDSGNALNLLEFRELEQQVENAIKQLPPQVKTAFELSRKQGLTHEEIAQRMGISRITSKSYISRAILAIRQYLRDRG